MIRRSDVCAEQAGAADGRCAPAADRQGVRRALRQGGQAGGASHERPEGAQPTVSGVAAGARGLPDALRRVWTRAKVQPPPRPAGKINRELQPHRD